MSIETSFKRMAGPCSPIELGYTPAPEDVCGGIRPNNSDIFIPVSPHEVPLNDVPDELAMYEYVDAAGNVRGNLLSVPSDSASPAWHIKPHAGDGSYYEHHHTVAGAGVLDIWFHGNNWLTIGRQYPLPEQPDISPTLIVKDGDTFQVRAGKLGLHVFALFLEAPFRDEYEERVAVPLAHLQAKV